MVKRTFNFKKIDLEKRLQVTKKEPGGLHSILRSTLLCSRLMGLLPLSGLRDPSSHKLRFTFRSPYTIYYMTTIFGQVLMFIMCFWWLTQNEIYLINISNFLFYTSSLISSLLLVNIGRYWPKVIEKAESIEQTLPPFSRNVPRLCNVTMVLILLLALVEHLLSIFHGLAVAYSCGPNNIYATFFTNSMPWIFQYTPYAIWKGIIIEIFNIQSTFTWSFNDLLVIIISIYLTEHFIVHNKLLKRAVKQEDFSCIEFRKQYLNIVRLVRLINNKIGVYILVSFGSNLYWICTQLFYSMNKSKTGHYIECQNRSSHNYSYLHGVEHSIYFIYSISFLAVRTLLVLLLAARIHSNSTLPLIILYNVPSNRFNVEVERFITQINNIKVALSGLDFFYVTRNMILTLLGTIVTYELVLLQFNK